MVQLPHPRALGDVQQACEKFQPILEAVGMIVRRYNAVAAQQAKQAAAESAPTDAATASTAITPGSTQTQDKPPPPRAASQGPTEVASEGIHTGRQSPSPAEVTSPNAKAAKVATPMEQLQEALSMQQQSMLMVTARTFQSVLEQRENAANGIFPLPSLPSPS